MVKTPKSTLSEHHKTKLNKLLLGDGNDCTGRLFKFAEFAEVSPSSLYKARAGVELSTFITERISKAIDNYEQR